MWSWDSAPIKFASTAVSLVVGLTVGTYKGGEFINTHFAHSSDMQLTNLRLEEKILTDRVAAIQQRIWALEKEYDGEMTKAPDAVNNEYRQMGADLLDVRAQIQSVMTAYRTGGYNASDTYYKYEQPHR